MNEQLSGHGPRGSHHGVKRSVPPSCTTSSGRIRAQWSFKITLASMPGPSASVDDQEQGGAAGDQHAPARHDELAGDGEKGRRDQERDQQVAASRACSTQSSSQPQNVCVAGS